MKYFIVIFTLIFSVSCVSQSVYIPIVTKVKLKPPFRNNGEKQNYKALQIFKKEYKKTDYAKFNGEIIIKDTFYPFQRRDTIEYIRNSTIQFGNIQKIVYNYVDSEHLLILEKGLFYPEIFGVDSMKIGIIKELDFLSNSPKVKRFRFILFHPVLPDEFSLTQYYYFELINEKANKKTDWPAFIEGAKLTFVKYGFGKI